MADIHAYRQIVELQVEIVRLSRQNAALEQKCKQLQEELVLHHKKQTARQRIRSAIRDLFRPKTTSVPNIAALMRPGNLTAVLERIWQGFCPDPGTLILFRRSIEAFADELSELADGVGFRQEVSSLEK